MFTLQNFALQETIKWTYCHDDTGENSTNPEMEDTDNLKQMKYCPVVVFTF